MTKGKGNYVKTFDPLFDRQVTRAKLNYAFIKMKIDKAPGLDQILNEHLKYVKRVNKFPKMINLIFVKHVYTSTWA